MLTFALVQYVKINGTQIIFFIYVSSYAGCLLLLVNYWRLWSARIIG